MLRVLGANATAGTLWFVIADDAVLSTPDTVSFQLASGKSRSDALRAGADELAAFLQRHKVDRVALAEPQPTQTTYQSLLGRMTVEIVLEFGASAVGIELERVSRQRIKASLGLDGRGSTSDFAKTYIDEPLAPHWTKKRDVAAMAALACS
ncbi:hypothetical protein ASD11_15050 [Aeromicrobium sp. Root495]|uniref:hypothetical protein n=1 Tax=Aeromicrobium sp. Root495 TaxID=1736550 RepID=UPI0006F6D067|nr:hypothetical protein [Aeromicrobium sp. Root495]KQY55819.1 hypothetical protein ASD11_15050 [Aeromicrobium sp. Root495]